MSKMKKMFAIGALALTMGVTTLSASTVKADENVNYEQYERSAVPNMDNRFSGDWVYKYTYQPYAFYYHTGTRQWKAVQVTGYFDHTVNTVVNGWAQSLTGGWMYP